MLSGTGAYASQCVRNCNRPYPHEDKARPLVGFGYLHEDGLAHERLSAPLDFQSSHAQFAILWAFPTFVPLGQYRHMAHALRAQTPAFANPAQPLLLTETTIMFLNSTFSRIHCRFLIRSQRSSNQISTRKRLRRFPARFEQLETRSLLSVTPLPLGFSDTEQTELTVRDALTAPGEIDRFEVELAAGDVIGATVLGHGQLNPTISLIGSDDTLLWFNDDHSWLGSSSFMAHESPLPRLNSNSSDSILQYVIDQPGTYFIDVAAAGGSTSAYEMDLVLARSAMEAEPAGATQILYVDFDGATVQSSRFTGGSGLKRLSPLRDFLPNWSLTAATDENAVIDVVMATIHENLSKDVRRSGINGDFAESGKAGEFNIQFFNSRDNPEFDDQFGVHPYMSRVVVGGTTGELGLLTVAQAQGIDVGNFLFTDDAVVMLDWLSSPAGAHPASLNQYDVHPSSSMAELVGTALGVLASHEASHNFGNWHTDQLSSSPNIMDTRPVRHLVPGGIFGSPYNPDLDFGTDSLAAEATLGGQVNTLNVIAFGLATGKSFSDSVTLNGSFIVEAEPFVPVVLRTPDDQTRDLAIAASVFCEQSETLVANVKPLDVSFERSSVDTIVRDDHIDLRHVEVLEGLFSVLF